MSVAGTPNMGSWLSNQGGLQGMDLWASPQAAYDAGVNVNEPGAYTLYVSMGSVGSITCSWLCVVTEDEHGTGLGSSDYWTMVFPQARCVAYRNGGQNNTTAGSTVLYAPATIPSLTIPDGIARIDGTMQSMLYWRSYNGGGAGRCDFDWGCIDDNGSGSYYSLGLGHGYNAVYTGDTSWSRDYSVSDWRPAGDASGSYEGVFRHAFRYTFESAGADYLYTQLYQIAFSPRVFIADVS